MPFRLGDLTLYDTDEICKALGVTRRTLYSYIKTGRLRATKFGGKTFVSEEALREFFKVPPKEPT